MNAQPATAAQISYLRRLHKDLRMALSIAFPNQILPSEIPSEYYRSIGKRQASGEINSALQQIENVKAGRPQFEGIVSYLA